MNQTSTRYISYNGNIVEANQPVFTASNRAFRYGDAIFETIKLMGGDLLFLDKHLHRLKTSMAILGMKMHNDFSFHNLHLIMRHLDQVNALKGHGRIRFEVFRKDGGFYTPVNNEVDYVVEADPVANKKFSLNETGMRIEIFTEHHKPMTKISNIKSSNALCYVMAGLHRRTSGFDDCLVLNTSGNICEAISSNIFIVNKGTLITPPLSEGCVAGVMREVILEMALEANEEVVEKPISVLDLLAADEIFLTDVINGIRWVGAFRQKRYFNAYSKQLMKRLNEIVLVK